MAGVQQLLDCMISSWYPQFERVTFKTALLPLPPPVLEWLVSDGLQLPEDSQAFATRGPLEEHPTEDDYQDWQSEDEGEAGSQGSSPAAAAQPPPPELAELREQVQAAIEALGGRVVPKLSWSCPKDAVWMSPTSSLCCTNADEVLLLLRSSDRVAHDICHALPEAAASAGQAVPPAATHCLALRRWYDLQPGREFRCFVRGGALAGVSQRDLTQRFDFLGEERAELAAAIQAFHAKHIQGRFPQPDYTYDAYVATSGAVKLLDFNPVGGTTAPLLFSWEELGLAGADAGAGREAQPAGAPTATVAAAQASAEAAACGGCACGAQPPSAAEAGEGSGGVEAAAEPSYLEQLRWVQALSLGDGRGRGASEQPAPAPAAGAAAGKAAGEAAAAAEGAGPSGGGLDFRIIEEAVALRPATLAYGVPFDFVDSSEGSALDRLMQQAQQAGAGELWAALAQQGSGGGANGMN